MKKHPDVDFFDSVRQMRGKRTERTRRLNTALAEATHICDHMAFESTILRVELYHICQAESGTNVSWHRHPFTELTWIEGGPVTYEHHDGEVTVHDGEHFLMPAFRPHGWHTLATDTVIHGFMLTLLPAADSECSLAQQIYATASAMGHRLPAEAAAAAALGQAEEAAAVGDAFGIEAARGGLRVGLSHLFRRIATTVRTDETQHMDHNRVAVPSAVEQAVAFITAHLSYSLDAASIAHHAGLSTRQLDRLFHQSFGLPTGAFILHTRLGHARHLLRESDLSIKQLADRCGFSDANYFSRIFRQRHGLSPGAYRRQGDTVRPAAVRRHDRQ